jgi:signal transduction histidine kinase
MLDGKQSTNRKENPLCKTLIHDFFSPIIGFTLIVAYATGHYDLIALATGVAMTGTMLLFWRLDRAFIHPLLKRIPQDWLQLEMETFISIAGHIAGALLALVVCGHLFDFKIDSTTSWIVMGAMMIVFPIIHGVETALGYYRQLKEKEQQEEQLRTLATQAELKALKAQINPHFLFNTLNTIAALVHANPAQAEVVVERLADMFRYVLASTERGMVPLEKELAFVDDYLAIERARYGKRLRVAREVDPKALLDMPMPSLILQPLVENAIRHGRGNDGSIDLTIRVRSDGHAVTIAIADQGPGMHQEKATAADQGVGLRNVDERLQKTYGEGYGLEIAANEPQGTIVTLGIPAGEKK